MNNYLNQTMLLRGKKRALALRLFGEPDPVAKRHKPNLAVAEQTVRACIGNDCTTIVIAYLTPLPPLPYVTELLRITYFLHSWFEKHYFFHGTKMGQHYYGGHAIRRVQGGYLAGFWCVWDAEYSLSLMSDHPR